MDVVGSNPVGTFSPLSWFFSIKGGQHWFANIKMCNISENGAVLFFLVEYCIRFLWATSNLTSRFFSKFSRSNLFVTLNQRFICSPRKFRFFKQPMNLVDFCAIIPFLLDLVIGGLQVSHGFIKGIISLRHWWELKCQLELCKCLKNGGKKAPATGAFAF